MNSGVLRVDMAIWAPRDRAIVPNFRGQGAKKEIGKKNDQRRRRRNRRRWGHLAHLVTHLVHVQFERSAVQDPGVAPMFWIRPCPSRMTQEPEEPKRPTPRRAD